MIKDIKDLAKVISLCRKTGVAFLKLGDLELQLGNSPIKPSKFLSEIPEANLKIPKPNLIDQGPDIIETPNALSEEDQLFYSAREHNN